MTVVGKDLRRMGDGPKIDWVAKAEKMGFSLEPEEPGPEFKKHAEILPPMDADVVAAELERRASYEMLNGSMDGYESNVRIPCQGVLRWDMRVVNANTNSVSFECDVCGYEAAVARSAFDPRVAQQRAVNRTRFPDRYVNTEMKVDIKGQEEALGVYRQWFQEIGAVDVPTEGGRDLSAFLPGICLYGRPGVGKTQIMVTSALYVIRRYSLDARYWMLADLLDHTRPRDTPDEQEASSLKWSEALSCDLLVLDDLGAEKPTDHAIERLQMLLDHRYRNALPLLVSSNIPPATWDETFGGRAASRLRGLCLAFEVTGQDLRKPERPQPLNVGGQQVDPSTGEIVG